MALDKGQLQIESGILICNLSIGGGTPGNYTPD